MSSHNHPFEAYGAPVEKADPGDAGSINIDRSPMVVNLVSTAAAQTRTLARPTRQGAEIRLQFKTDGGGDITVTVTGGYNETGDTTIVFANAGEFAILVSFFDGSDFFWRLTSHHGIGNMSITEAGVLNGLTATVNELNNVADVSGRVVAVTPTAASTVTLDPATHGDKTILITTSTISFNVAVPALTGTGNRYRIVLGASLSSATMTITAPGAHLFGAVQQNTDSANGTSGFTVGQINAAGSTVITLNGTTQGGRKGDYIEIEDVATSHGQIRGTLNASGSEATPFS